MRRPARRPAPLLLAPVLTLLVLLTPALTLIGPGAVAQEVDEALLKEDVLAEMTAAGTYRLLRYDVRNDERRLEVIGEVDLAQGGKLVSLADGTITSTDAASGEDVAEDGALRFYRAGGEGWMFDRMEKTGGELVYVFRQEPPASAGKRTPQTTQLMIAATTMLPVSYLESGSGPGGPYAEQSVYFDYGDPIGPALAGGTPVAGASPVAQGCGSAASSAIEVAEAFVAAASMQDLERAGRCFAPGRQPATWGDAFLGGDEAGDDVSGCRGVPYTVYESKIQPGFSAIVFRFNQACAIAVLDDWQRDLYDVDTMPVTTLLVQTHRHDQRWYVQDALALVPD